MIILDHVTYRYDAENAALEDISLTIEDGELLAVVGHNGSGKSTLAKHLNALLLPDAGAVTVDGLDTRSQANTLAIRQKVGMVFQNPDNQLVTTVVEEDVAFGPENLGMESSEIRRRVDEALCAVGMEGFAKKAPHMLSGGQKQRIAIAGMLAMGPEVLVLDEATAMLDPRGRRDVLHILQALHKQGITVVMITQHMEEAALCDRVVVMAGGHLITEGPPREVFAQEEMLKGHRLDLPPVVRMRNMLEKGGMELPMCLTIEELAEAICQYN
ncbi:MAG: energy-coupling factor transporter ATPase [Clostridia bacterium]|nr:energy-coupling factor transporter ATPase [Clostridia bacterium]